MAEHDWKQLLDDPEIEGIIGRVRNGPGRRFYGHGAGSDALALDDLESWLWDKAVDIAIRYTRAVDNTRVRDATRHWHAWLYVTLNRAIVQGEHRTNFKGKPGSSRRDLVDHTGASIEQVAEAYGDVLEKHVHGGLDRTYASDPAASVIRLERLEGLLDRLQQTVQAAHAKRADGHCADPLCDRPVLARERCSSHYARWRTLWGAGDTKACETPDCDRPATSRGRCQKCYNRWRETSGTTLCTAADCGRPILARSLCSKHYAALRYASRKGRGDHQ